VPGTVGGRRAHPPKAEKIWTLKINVKEKRKAIRSALAACLVKELVEKRGHRVPKEYPFIVQSDIEQIAKTKDLIQSLKKLGFEKELERTQVSNRKTGVAKLRGRGKVEKKGLLIVTSVKESPILKSASSVPGVEAVFVNELNAELLAPGSHLGRITLFTDKAIDLLNTEKLFTKNYKGEKQGKVKKEKPKKAIMKTKPITKQDPKTVRKTIKKAVKKEVKEKLTKSKAPVKKVVKDPVEKEPTKKKIVEKKPAAGYNKTGGKK